MISPQPVFDDPFISIHASRVGGDDTARSRAHSARISIHASRVGGDAERSRKPRMRGISIHASRVGGDRDAR